MKKRILMLALMLTLLISTAAAFSDVSDTQTSLAVETLYGMGIVSGGVDGNYYPDATLTRAQFCKMAVLAEGHGEQVSASAYKTLFSDVPGGNWAAPYVNLAYSEGLVSGYGNGFFGPDDAVSVSQAATIALHLLGYTNTDIGPFWPEDYMSKASGLGLLDGVSGAATDPMTRGEAAVLLYNLLGKNTTQGKPFYQGLAATTVTSAVLTDNAEITVYANNTLTDYTHANPLPEALVGERGTLLLSSAGKAVGFLPDDNLRRTVAVTDVDASALNGIAIDNAVTVVLDEERTTWQNCWYDLRRGDEVVIYYNAAGTMDLLWVKTRTAGSEATVVGYYEDATPNTTAPSTITVLGASLTVTDEGRAALKGFAIGDKIAVTLNAAGKVTGVASAGSSATMTGILKSTGADKVEVELLSGLTVSGKPYSTVSASLVGGLVKVSAPSGGKLSVSALGLTPSAVSLDALTLAEDVKVYERVNGSVLTELDPDDLPETVGAASILHAGKDAEGKVDLLVLSDVTGAAYTYGFLIKGEKQGGSGTLSYTNNSVAVENSSGKSTEYITGLSFTDGAVGGVAHTAEGKAAAIVILTAREGLTRTDFSSSDSVGGMSLADDVQVYNNQTGKWTTLSAAKAFTDSFTAYYDTWGVVRVLFAE